MMSKKLLNQLFLLLLLSGIVFACINDNDPFGDSGRQSNGNRGRQPLSPEAMAARAWFESEVGREFLTWHPGTDEAKMLMPNWRRTFSNADSEYKVTEVRMQGNRTMARMTSETAERFRQTKNHRYLASDTRFVLRTHIETGETVGFIMIVHPDLEQIQRRRNNPLQGFTYLKRDKDFSGFVSFYDLNGKFVNGWQHRNGEFYAIFPAEMTQEQPQLRSGLCGLHCWEIWLRTRTYVNGEFIGERVEFVRTECIYIVCFPGNPPGNNNPPPNDDDDDDDDGGGDNGRPGFGGGGTSGPQVWAPHASRIFRNSNLTETNWRRLEAKILKIKDHCLGEAVFNGLAYHLENANTQMNFRFGERNSFFMNRTGSPPPMITLSMGKWGRSNNLLHEMVHAYQAFGEDFDSFYGAFINLEMEARIIQYQFVSSLPEYHVPGNQWERLWTNDSDRYEVTHLLRYIDTDGSLRPGAPIDYLNKQIERARAALEAVPAYSGRPFDESREGTANFKNLQRLSENC